MTSKLKLVVFSLLPALLLVGLLEAFAWVAIHRDIRVLSDPVTGEPYVYGMRIGKFGDWSSVPLNTLGYPEPEFTEGFGHEGCFRILVLGDSFTFGDSVDLHENWVSLLRRSIAVKEPDRCIRLINAGERMTTLTEQSERLGHLLPIIEPDVVLLVQFQNDLSDLTNEPEELARTRVAEEFESANSPQESPAGPEEPRSWGQVIYDRVPFGNASLIRFLSYRLSAFLITRGIEHDILDTWSVLEDPRSADLAVTLKNTYRRLFGDLLETLSLRNIDLGVIIFPSKFDVMAGRYPEGEYFAALAEDHEVPYLDLTPVFLEHRRPYAFQMYDGHLNPHGNALAAQEISSWLLRSAPFLRSSAAPPAQDWDLPSLKGMAEFNLR